MVKKIIFSLSVAVAACGGDDSGQNSGSKRVGNNVTPITAQELDTRLAAQNGWMHSDLAVSKSGVFYDLLNEINDGMCNVSTDPVNFQQSSNSTFMANRTSSGDCTSSYSSSGASGAFGLAAGSIDFRGRAQEQWRIDDLTVVTSTLNPVDLVAQNMNMNFILSRIEDVYVQQIRLEFRQTLIGDFIYNFTEGSGSITTTYKIHKTSNPAQGCTILADTVDDCTVRGTLSVNISGFSRSDVSEWHYESVTVQSNSTNPGFFTAGQIDFNQNDWSGTIIFNGMNSDPAYEANSADDLTSGVISALPFAR